MGIERVGWDAGSNPYTVPAVLGRIVEFEDERVLVFGCVADAFPHVAISTSGQVEETEVYGVFR